MSATSDFPQTFRGKDGNLTDRPRIGDTAVSLAPDGKTVLEETPVTAQFLREHRKGENRKNSGDPYYHQRRSGGRAAQYHGRPHIDEQRAARKAEQNKMLGDFDATMQTAADAGYRPLGNPTERLASRNLNDRDKQDVLNEGRRLAAATDASQVTERPKGATPEETAKLDREFDKQEVIRDGRLVQRGVADREAAARATKAEARKKINENRVTAAKQRVQDDATKPKQTMDRIQSATPSTPHVLRDKKGNVVGYSYRGQKPPKGATKEQVAATRKAEADTARATKIDGVAAKDAVAIGSRTNADERFDAQHGTKQAQLGGGSYQNRITGQKNHDAKMAAFADPKSRSAIGQGRVASKEAERTNANKTPIGASTPTLAQGMTNAPRSPVGQTANPSNIRTALNTNLSSMGSGGGFANIDGTANKPVPQVIANRPTPNQPTPQSSPKPTVPATPKRDPAGQWKEGESYQNPDRLAVQRKQEFEGHEANMRGFKQIASLAQVPQKAILAGSMAAGKAVVDAAKWATDPELAKQRAERTQERIARRKQPAIASK